MAFQGLFTGGVKIRNLNGYLIAVNGEVFATTNTGGTTYAFFYVAKTTITSGDPGNSHIIWNNATQTSATQINVSHLTDSPVEDIDIYLAAIVPTNRIIIQDRDDSERFQIWTVSGAPTQVGTDYWTIPVTLVQSQGAAFSNNHDLLFAIVSGGSGGGGTTTNSITFNNGGSGAASGTSFNGGTAVTISYNTIGAQVANANLTSLAGLSYASTAFVKMTGANTFTLDTNTYLTANQTITLSGNVTGSGSTSITTTIANNVVTNAMLAQIATARIKGRVTAATGNVEDLTGTQVTTLLDTFTSTLKGLVPSPGSVGSTRFLREDGTWVVPSGGSPAGSNTQIQYNNSGAFGASANFTWDGSSLVVTAANANGIIINGNGTGGGGASQTRLAWRHNGADRGLFFYDEAGQLFSFQSSGVGRSIQVATEAGTILYGTGSNTNVRIGDATAANAKLSVAGTALINTNTNNGVDTLQVNGSAIATTLKVNTSGQTLTFSNYYAGGTGRNIWIGGGGTSSNSSAWGNVSLGDGALNSVTSGFFNTAIGGSALQALTTGNGNMALGFEALPLVTTGSGNTAIGVNALGNSTGSDNTAIGNAALLLMTTPSNNVGIGRDAGRRISGGGNNETSSQSVYIGNDTRSSANGNTNEIVIGHNAIGQGSNSVTLGNSSITQTLLRGTVTGGSFVKSGGTSSQILAADGSVITAGTGITISGGTISSTGGGGGTTTFAVTFNNSGTGAASGTTFDGSVARTISYNTLGANKVITSGTAAPTGGVDGDIYLQYDVSLLTGSGTTNYIPKFTSSSAIGNSQIFDNGTNVGIGTTSPANKFHVVGNIFADNANGTIIMRNGDATNQQQIRMRMSGNDGILDVTRNSGTAPNLIFGTEATERMRIDNNGNVGIGTASPANKVDIFTTNRTALNTVGSGLNVNYNGSTTGEFATIGFSWASSIGNNSTRWGMGMVGTNFGAGTGGLNLFTNGSERMRIDESGFVGIGYTAPAARLAVNGTALINTNTDNGVDALQVNGNVTATQYSATVQTLTDGATITFNANNGSNAVVTLGGNRTLAFSNTRTGAYYTLRVIQDGTGGRTLAMPASVRVIGGGGGVVTLSTAANSVDLISFYFDGTNYWTSFGQNYT